MTVVYQTSDVCLAERRRYWCDALSRTFVPLEVRESAERQFFGKLASTWLGQALVSELSSRPQACVRTDETIRSRGGRNLLQVGLLLAGRADVTQDGRTARLGPGGLVIYETSRSFRWSFPVTDWDLMIATFPRADFAFSAAQSRRLTARDLSFSGAAGPILATYLRELREQAAAPDGCVSARLGDTAADLVTTTMLENLSDPGTASALDRTLCQKVVSYVEDNLGDPDLTPARIADAHYISRRYLYMIFTASQKMPVLEWIRLRRLERCRRALLDPALAEIPVGRIAARWGMPNPALFSRAFKRIYGLSPSAYRQHYGPRLPGCGGPAGADGPGRYAGCTEGPQPVLPAASALL